jgi:hypothetical protein
LYVFSTTTYFLKFLKVCWDIIKSNILEFFNEFHENVVLPKVFTASFITIIPKKDHLQSLSDYPKCVLKELVSIQRNFLWGGIVESKKICWVSWDRICQPKNKGDLGIKDLKMFNQSLLYKWKWRCLHDNKGP